MMAKSESVQTVEPAMKHWNKKVPGSSRKYEQQNDPLHARNNFTNLTLGNENIELKHVVPILVAQNTN